MSDEKVDIKINKLVDNADIHEVVENISKAFNRNTPEFKARLKQSIELPETAKALQKGVSQDAAEKVCNKLKKLGLECKIEQPLTIDFEVIQPKFVCPACGHEQEPDNSGNDVCTECGVVGSKYAAHASKAKIYESEKRRLENQRKVQEQDALDHQERQKEEAIREQIREQLGVKKANKNPATKIIFGLIAVACGALAYTQSGYFSAPETSEDSAIIATKKQNTASSPHQPQTIARAPKPITITDLQRVAKIQTLVSNSNTMGAGSQFAQVDENFDEALAAYEAISSPDEQMVAMASITDSLQSFPDPSPSLRKLETHFTSAQGPSKKLLEEKIVQGWLNTNNDEQAIHFVNKIEDKFEQTTALRTILEHQINTPEKTEATRKTMATMLERAETLNTANQEAQVYSAISTAYALMGKKAESEKFLDLAFTKTDLILQLEEKIDAYCHIAEDRMKINDEELGLHLYQNATELAFGLSKYNPAKPAALRSLAISQARIGNFLDAREAVNAIKNKTLKIKTLSELAKFASEAENPTLAKSFLSQAKNETTQVKNSKEKAQLALIIEKNLSLIAFADKNQRPVQK